MSERRTVTWRRAVAAAAAAAFCLVALVVVFRSDGLPSVDAASSRATRWFVHRPTGQVVLADGYGGRALARLAVGSPGSQLSIAEGPTGAYVINDDTNEVRAIDTAELRLGPPVGLSALGAGRAVSGVSGNGLVVADPTSGAASLLQTSGEQASFDVPSTPSNEVQIAPDGAIWSVEGSQLVRTTSVASTRAPIGAADVELSLVGNRPFLLDRTGRRARLGDGSWQAIPTSADPSELAVQVPGPPNECGWVGTADQLWCIDENGVHDQSTVEGLAIGGSDILAIAGSAAALVHRGPSAIVRFDWRSHEVLNTERPSIAADEPLQVTATVDLIWIDETVGDFVWGVHPWGIEPIRKDDERTLLLGETGEVIDEGDASQLDPPGVDDNQSDSTDRREPDNNGIDDPPVAVDDVVTARSGTAVSVEVTANDYDPDGEAVAVVEVDEPDNGTVDIGTASTVVYNPDPGFVGVERFDYTITDGDGTEATATVTVELLPADAANQAPIGTKDRAETGSGVAVVVDVLANDVDPERDALRLDSFEQPSGADAVGTVTQTVGPRGLAALKFDPAPTFQGTAVFRYRPADVFGATGAEVEVRVDVAGPGAENRPPYAGPDAVRVRRNVSGTVPVLANDVDPDGDRLTISLVEPLPDRLTVEVGGKDLKVTAGVGSADLLPFQYEIDDGAGHQARAWVLVAVIGDVEPNQPPVVTADTGTVVAGSTVSLDVLANDSDPDSDPLSIIDVTQPSEGGRAVAFDDSVSFVASERSGDERVNARFMYTVSDGNGHEVSGQVSVAILPERLLEPPFARDDSTVTFVDTPVTIDVLRNDGDPSGERPSLAGSPGCPAGGEAEVTPQNRVRFTPPPGESGTFRCSYEVTNSQGLRAGAEIIVSVRAPEPGNEPPVANPDRLNLKVGETGTVTVTANDGDPDGDQSALRLIAITAPLSGVATRSGNTVTYTAPDTPGTATIRYTIEDPDGATASSTVQFTFTDDAVKQAPVANGAQREVEAPAGPVVFDVSSLIDDPDGSPDQLEVIGVQKASEAGAASWVGFTITVTPPASADFTGIVAARYTIEDADGLTASAVLTVNVVAPQNRPPEAKDDQLEVANSSSGSVNVLANDTDPDGDALTVSITSAPDPAIGTASVNGGTISFTAKKGASGPATVGYTVSDGELSDTAVVRVTVLPCTDSTPVARDAFLETGYQQPIRISLASYVTNGTITGSSGPPGWADPVYTPPAGENGNVTITYTVANGCADTTTGTITVDVNQSPVPQAQTLSLGKNESRTIPVANLAGDDEPLVITASPGAPSWVTTTPASLVIAPPPGTIGTTFSWTTTVQDPGGLTATVPISVSVSNQPPVAVNDLLDASDTTGPFAIVANDSDPDDPNSSLFVSSIPSVVQMEVGTATVTLLADGRRILIDTSSGQGRGGFYYTVSDPSGATSTAIVGFYGPPIPPPTTTTTTTTLPPTTTRPTLTIPPTTVAPTTSPPTTAPPTTTPPATTAPATVPNAPG